MGFYRFVVRMSRGSLRKRESVYNPNIQPTSHSQIKDIYDLQQKL